MSEPTISHYRILKKLGEGGMGEVYLAEDTQLNRKVALKRLSAKLGDNTEYARRFEREARAASALNQPNILTIYEIGKWDGQQFIAAEFVDGETLRERLRRGRLAISEALDIAVQMVSALAAAHEIGIIHRDIKPENIMLRRDGLVKVVDFGLAKLVAGNQAVAVGAEDSTQFQTRENSILGTIAYMSPEQTRGLPLDARTDLWSAGCVLYEMVTGRRPFEGASASDCLAAILRQEPAPAAHYVGEVPEELEQIIVRALTKEREARYQTANEMLADLRQLKRRLEISVEVAGERRKFESKREASPKDSPTAATQIIEIAQRERQRFSAVNSRVLFALVFCVLLIGSGLLYTFKLRQTQTSPGQINSLVVLPLKNIGGDAQDEYLSDGITDELITKLTKLKTVRVVSPSVAMRYKNSPKDATEIGRELTVEAVVEGTVRKVGTRFRLSIHLVNAQDGFELWSDDDFESELNNLLDAERQIAEAVASRLKGQLTPQERNLVARGGTTDADAYELLLRGKQQARKGEWQLARDLFDRAIQLDPNFADAYAWRGLVIYQLFAKGLGDRSMLDAALSDANRALQIDPNLISARRTLINIYHSTGQYEEGLKQAKRALETNADDLDAIEGAALAYFRAGMMEKAITMYQRAIAADPIDRDVRIALSRSYLHDGEYQKGLDALDSISTPNTDFYWLQMLNYRGLGLFDKAIEAGKLQVSKFDFPYTGWLDLGITYKLAGKPDEARAVWKEAALRSEERLTAVENSRTRVWLGFYYAELGERENAIAQINRALTLEPNDAWTLFQVSALESILNNRREAVEYLKQSIAHGWLGIHYVSFNLNPTGAAFYVNLRDDAEFQQVRADLQRKVDGLAAKY